MKLANARVVVAGSANMDCATSVSRLPKMGETLTGADFRFSPGGKGLNQAVAAARMGAETFFIARLGGDEFGARLRTFLAGEHINLAGVRVVPESATGAAFVAVCGGDNAIIVSPGANRLLRPRDAGQAGIRAGDVLLAQLEIPARTVARFLRAGKKQKATTILNPSPAIEAGRAAFAAADVIVVNAAELDFFAPPPGQFAARARKLLSRDNQAAIVTLGAKGLLCATRDSNFRLPAFPAKAADSTGAGDCFAGTLAAQLSRGKDLRAAAVVAAQAAAVCVTRPGAATSMPRLKELA